MSNILKSHRIAFISERPLDIGRNNSDIRSPVIPESTEQNLWTNEKTNTHPENIREETETLLNEARIQAELIMKNAQKKASELLEASKANGYAEGYEKGLEEGKAASKEFYTQGLTQVEAMKLEAIRDINQFYLNSEKEIVNLAIEIAQKIINIKINSEDETFLNLAKNVLKRAKSDYHLCIKVSSEDFHIVEKAKDSLKSQLFGVKDITIEEDKFLSKGSCIVDTDFGIIDGGVDTQLNQIKSAFFELITNS